MRYLAIAGLCLLLVGCGNSAVDPQPSYSCVKTGEPYSCRGGPCYPCIQYGISCPVPLKLKDENSKLVCRLDEKP